MPDLWGIAQILVKSAMYLGILGAAGTVFAARLFGPDLGLYRGISVLFAVLGVLAVVLDFLLRAVALTGDASAMADPVMLGLLWSTPVGEALVWRLGGLVLLMLGLLVGRGGLWLCQIGGCVALLGFGRVGHVSGLGVIWFDIALMLHLCAIALWIGILIPLRRLVLTDDTQDQAARLGLRFGQLASLMVPALIVAGGGMAYGLLGSFGALWGTGYGQALLLKLGLVIGLLMLAAGNKLRFVPRLRAGDSKAGIALSRAIWMEWVVFLGVLITSATLTSVLILPM